MSVLAQAVYEYVKANPGMKAIAIAKGMEQQLVAQGRSPNSVSAYLSMMRSSGMLTVRGERDNGTGVSLYFVDQAYNADVLKQAMPASGNKRRGRKPYRKPYRPTTNLPLGPESGLRAMLRGYGPQLVISALQTTLLEYGRDHKAWRESMTEEVTEVFEGAFDILHDTMKLNTRK